MASEPSLSRLSSLFTCQTCNGVGLPRKVATKGADSVVIAMSCQACGREWHLTRIITREGATTFKDGGNLFDE